LQPNSVTVQKIVDEALSKILNETIQTIGAGRTDAGVHATFFCAHFDSNSEDLDIGNKLVFKLNRFLPPDISIISIRKVIPDANARYSAISRTYKYFISRSKDPFSTHSSWYLHGNIDVSLMNEASNLLMEYDDFTSFSRLHGGARTNICRIYSAHWDESGNQLVFTIKADRFLRNMVRAIVGTLVDLGFGKMSLDEFREVIASKDRCRAGMSAPAQGLFLTDIEYPDEIFLSQKGC